MTAVKNKRVPLFDEEVSEKVTSVDELWKILKSHWNILDYDVLLFVIDLTDCKEAQKILDDFLTKVDFSVLKDMDLVLEHKVYGEETLMRPILRVKVNVGYCTYSIVRKVKEIVCKKFDLEKYSLYCKGIKEGCVQLQYQISAAVMSYLLKLEITGSMMADFNYYNVTRFEIYDMILEVPHRVVNMVSGCFIL